MRKKTSNVLLNTNEVAKNLFGSSNKKHYERVLKLIHQKEIKSIRIGGSYYIKKSVLERWIDS